MRKSLGAVLAAGAMSVGIMLTGPGVAAADSSGAGIENPPNAVGKESAWIADFPGAEQHPASPENYSAASRPGSTPINKVVIHVTQGSWAGSLSWFANPEAQVSAHYTVRSSDGKVAQSVPEKDIAWHAGNWSYNETSIGIEHEGFVDDPKWFTEAMYQASAKVTANAVKTHGIPLDRQHIVGHNEVPGATHTDPGPHWNWDHYMQLVAQYAA
ncbi:N-acetylmuramoyl-L-alanine amidase [Amycolatopsis antarctica]|uniref:N-acetylmuramoyl-L-alanine amidase n=1 Tax=Amycolatopsis antarctica TaxID=1854586 RepID=A0A263DBG2_9PSEU|nr:peptidoglycan recognition family protein [Amycolatopsis antarctica]OZM74725.1 N-acetylmuramoyl-L-alanine amidase [Amycolatopsis antarctica]